MGYYFKNEEEQDMVVSVPAMLSMFDGLATPDDNKRKVAFPEAGDHVIGSPLTSGSVDKVRAATVAFFEQVLGLQAAEQEAEMAEAVN
jgi:hypothetical protein